jgi:GNAT superfamily N-acetyltransferase
MPFDPAAPEIAFARETWARAVKEMWPLWHAHWREVGLDHDVAPLAMDIETYERMEAAGNLHVVTARGPGGAMVGYVVAIVQQGLHYRTTVFANLDLYYLTPAVRRWRNGVRLFRFAEESLKERGAKIMNAGTKVHISPVTGKRLDISPILRRLGWREIERVHRKVIEWQ